MPTAREQARELFDVAFPDEASKILRSIGVHRVARVRLRGTKVLVTVDGLRATINSTDGAGEPVSDPVL